VPEKCPAKRRNPNDPVDAVTHFISACAQTRKQLDPENLKANVGRAVGEFFDGMDEDSKKLVADVAGMFRRPR
jgi:hypothetical protein